MRRLLLPLLVCLLTGGCARQPRPPRTLRLAANSDLSTLDPALSYDTGSIPYVRVLYRGLVDYGNGADIVNVVARSHTVSADRRIYSFQLRNDVHFHSGRRVVAEDFRYQLERVLDPATASDGFTIYRMIDGAEEFSNDRKQDKAKWKLRHVRGIEVKGDDEIVFHLKKPDPTFLNWMTLPFTYAVPPEDVQKWGKQFSEHPDGCGPFKFVSWTHDRELVLEKNPKYFQPELPKCDRIEVQIGGDDTLHLMRFELGDIDIQSLEDAPSPDFLRILRDRHWQPYTQHISMTDIRYVCLNTEMKPLDNVLVRRAINYAINRERIKTVDAGRAVVAYGPLPQEVPGNNPNLPRLAYNPDKARELLRQAGFANGFTLSLWYAPKAAGWYEPAAQSIKQDLAQVGITVNLRAVTYPELKSAAGTRKKIEMSIIGWYGDFPDASNFLDVLLNGKNITDVSCNNRAFYNNPAVNKLIDEAGSEPNATRRIELYQEAERQIALDAPWVCLLHTERYSTSQPWISGYKLHAIWSARYEYVGVNFPG